MIRERGNKYEAARILGIAPRTVNDLAAKGTLPGAAKIGGQWTYNLAKLSAMVREREDEACRGAKLPEGPSGATELSTVGFKPGGGTSSGHFGQTIRKLRKSAAERVRLAL